MAKTLYRCSSCSCEFDYAKEHNPVEPPVCPACGAGATKATTPCAAAKPASCTPRG